MRLRISSCGFWLRFGLRLRISSCGFWLRFGLRLRISSCGFWLRFGLRFRLSGCGLGFRGWFWRGGFRGWFWFVHYTLRNIVLLHVSCPQLGKNRLGCGRRRSLVPYGLGRLGAVPLPYLWQ